MKVGGVFARHCGVGGNSNTGGAGDSSTAARAGGGVADGTYRRY